MSRLFVLLIAVFLSIYTNAFAKDSMCVIIDKTCTFTLDRINLSAEQKTSDTNCIALLDHLKGKKVVVDINYDPKKVWGKATLKRIYNQSFDLTLYPLGILGYYDFAFSTSGVATNFTPHYKITRVILDICKGNSNYLSRVQIMFKRINNNYCIIASKGNCP